MMLTPGADSKRSKIIRNKRPITSHGSNATEATRGNYAFLSLSHISNASVKFLRWASLLMHSRSTTSTTSITPKEEIPCASAIMSTTSKMCCSW